ncbi:hypothetical protein DL98DRAFT_581542 [Cadophora sp. DSE1049]|nr:hypothetical protein DL98DRAFT_581542 [Cadophora sp. DSE1049]
MARQATIVRVKEEIAICEGMTVGQQRLEPPPIHREKRLLKFFAGFCDPSNLNNNRSSDHFPFDSYSEKYSTRLIVSTTSTVLPFTSPVTTTFTTNTDIVTATIVSTSTLLTKTTITPAEVNVRAAPETSRTARASQTSAYASPCSGVVRYSSACSCFGVTLSTTTLETPTVRTVATVTGTTSTT